MLRTMSGVGKYIQGYNALKEFGKYASALGSRPFVTGGKSALAVIKDTAIQSAAEYKLTCEFTEFTGKGTSGDVDNILKKARNFKADVIIGAGGGLSLDISKAVAYKADLPLVIIPTIASTDAPCSAEALIYTEDHRIDKVIVIKHNPDVVLVDSKIIAQAPTRFFAAGMGDALATWFEAATCERTGAPNFTGGVATALGMKIARMCYDILMEHGVNAKIAVDNNLVTPSVEMVIEANTLLSGLGFENCGLGAAHSVNVGLNTLKETRKCLHGELVAFGILVNLILENYPKEEIQKILKFFTNVGLPITLKQLGLENPTDAQLMQAAEGSLANESHMHNLAFKVNAGMIRDAIVMADVHGVMALKGEYLSLENSEK